MTDTNLRITIPEKMYVGCVRQGDEADVPLGYMTAHGTTSAFKKKMDRIDYIANRGTNTMAPVAFDNVPITGFKISRSLRRLGWYNQDGFIRVEDPRGFEVEISVSNLIMITDNNILHNGEILQPCMWGRDGNENKLLPTNSTPYLQAVANTERINKTVSVRSAKPGNEILLHSGERGTYLGSLYSVLRESNYRNENPESYTVSDKKRHVIRFVDPEDGDITYKGFTALKISEIVDASIQTKEDIQTMIFNDIAPESEKSVRFYNLDGQNYSHYTSALVFEPYFNFVSSKQTVVTAVEAYQRVTGRHQRKHYKVFAMEKNTNKTYLIPSGNFDANAAFPARWHQSRTYRQMEKGCVSGYEAVYDTNATTFTDLMRINSARELVLSVDDLEFFVIEAEYVETFSNNKLTFPMS